MIRKASVNVGRLYTWGDRDGEANRRQGRMQSASGSGSRPITRVGTAGQIRALASWEKKIGCAKKEGWDSQVPRADG